MGENKRFIMADGKIRYKSQSYASPSGEVYGATDWDDPIKLAEIGARPFREEPYDSAYYMAVGYDDNVVDEIVVRTYTLEATMLPQDVREKLQTSAKITARGNINTSDLPWQQQRFLATGVLVDPWVEAFRADTVNATDEFEDALILEEDYSVLIIMQPEWPDAENYTEETWTPVV